MFTHFLQQVKKPRWLSLLALLPAVHPARCSGCVHLGFESKGFFCFCFRLMASLLFGMGLNKGKRPVQICSGKLIPFAKDNLNSISVTRYFGRTLSTDQTSIHSIQATAMSTTPHSNPL